MNFTVDSENLIEELKKEVKQLKADNAVQAIRIEKLVSELFETRAILIKQLKTVIIKVLSHEYSRKCQSL
jgi:hypothetical protein